MKRRQPSARQGPRAQRKRSHRRWRLAKLLPSARLRRQALRIFRQAPTLLQGLILLAIAATLWLAVNWVYQVVRKPSELFFPVSGTLNKTPSETWRDYGPLFRRYSTDIVTPELLAALAQVEGAGNPVARTYWRWSLTARPFEVYRPASSSVGMYQITDGTFAEAKRYCIRRHAVVEDGPWNDWRSCWFNNLYVRVIPSHAVELTAAYLDRSIAGILTLHPTRSATLEREQELAALIHLCGAGAGDSFVRHGMRLADGQRCGDHDAREYLSRVDQARRVFRALEQEAGR